MGPQGSVDLYLYVFDETFATLRTQGSAIRLTDWYDALPNVCCILFQQGTDDIAIVEKNGRVKVFSWTRGMFL